MTANSDHYITMLEFFIVQDVMEMTQRSFIFTIGWGNSSHHTKQAVFQSLFRISCFGDIMWSRDLSVADFFLWGFLKHFVLEIYDDSSRIRNLLLMRLLSLIRTYGDTISRNTLQI